jgi:hypothetical protein
VWGSECAKVEKSKSRKEKSQKAKKQKSKKAKAGVASRYLGWSGKNPRAFSSSSPNSSSVTSGWRGSTLRRRS